MTGRSVVISGVRRLRWSNAQLILCAVLAVTLTPSQARAQSQPQAQAQTPSRHLACARGALEVCQSLVDQLRIAPGVREAAKQLLAEVQEGITRCDRGEADACIELLERYPDLPASVRDSLASAIAHAKSK